MECLIQYLDDLEDLFYAVALLTEKIRYAVQMIAVVSLAAVIPVCGVLLALSAPPLALASVFLALAILLYRAAVGHHPGRLAG
ncbi:MAG: hypothetical protein OEW68_09545 [Gammaproteobacteria bacterium]|nr:hypothetical protein [Gammaproteobacteria bacterium]MDH4315072.1 hypothetical protein [Gammaproteobacteria bacterium]MDH5214495.1 hypothetical protein [Gammaproteobacteria bacterium]MDH5500789.1 hypothetical protein [Gammaproteobacteria bacterium]